MTEREFTYTSDDPPPGEADTYEVPEDDEPPAGDTEAAGENEPDESEDELAPEG